jgi:hypothetical protein
VVTVGDADGDRLGLAEVGVAVVTVGDADGDRLGLAEVGVAVVGASLATVGHPKDAFINPLRERQEVLCGR